MSQGSRFHRVLSVMGIPNAPVEFLEPAVELEEPGQEGEIMGSSRFKNILSAEGGQGEQKLLDSMFDNIEEQNEYLADNNITYERLMELYGDEEPEEADDSVDEQGYHRVDEYEALQRYDETLNEMGPVQVAGYTYDVAQVLKAVDNVAYRTGFHDWLDSNRETIE